MSQGVGVLPQLFAEKKSGDLRVRKKLNIPLYCSGSSFLVHTMVNIFYMGQNTEVKFTNLSGWTLLCFLKNNLQTYIT